MDRAKCFFNYSVILVASFFLVLLYCFRHIIKSPLIDFQNTFSHTSVLYIALSNDHYQIKQNNSMYIIVIASKSCNFTNLGFHGDKLVLCFS